MSRTYNLRKIKEKIISNRQFQLKKRKIDTKNEKSLQVPRLLTDTLTATNSSWRQTESHQSLQQFFLRKNVAYFYFLN